MKGIFITGVDTGVGKTIISLGILNELRKSHKTAYMKAIETGIKKDNAGDAYFIKKMLSLPYPISTIRPIRLSSPMAPLVAFDIEKRKFDIQRIFDSYKSLKNNEIILVEGAGGLMCPITEKLYMADIAVLLQLSIVIVIANKLGAINHAMLTIEYAKSIELNIKCAVLNSLSSSESQAGKTNKQALEKLLRSEDISLFESPYIKDIHNIDLYTAFGEIGQHIIKS